MRHVKIECLSGSVTITEMPYLIAEDGDGNSVSVALTTDDLEKISDIARTFECYLKITKATP